MSDTDRMTFEEYEQLKELLQKAVHEDNKVKTDETWWFVLMAAQQIASQRYRDLRWPEDKPAAVPVPQSLRA